MDNSEPGTSRTFTAMDKNETKPDSEVKKPRTESSEQEPEQVKVTADFNLAEALAQGIEIDEDGTLIIPYELLFNVKKEKTPSNEN